MFGITDIVAYMIGVVLIIVLPGPNSLYCLSVSASYGRQAGSLAMLGVLIGDNILMIATVLGAGTLMRLYPNIFDVLKLIGGSYLAYLGIKLLFGAYHTFKNRHKLTNPSKPSTPAPHNYLYRSLTLSLTNPKAILFFLSFFVQFVEPSYPYPFLSFFVLALLLQLVSFLYLTLLIVSGQLLAQKFGSKPWLMISSMVLVGLLFIGFGVNLWVSKLS